MGKSFLQSSQWEKFQESVGRKVFRVENKLIIKHNLPLGLCYFYCPRPEFKDAQEFKKFATEIKKIAKAENAVFIRIEPNINSNNKIPIFNQIQNPNVLKFKIGNLNLERSRNLQPRDTLLLDLDQNESAILADMHPKTRYNIRLAERHKIKITHSTNVEDVETFYQLAIKTSQRDKFSYHSKGYYRKMIAMLGKNKTVNLYIATFQNKPIAAILVLFYESTAIYLHGASDHQFRKFMAPYLLQWQAIRDAKNRGCKSYDFWGIAPEEKNPTSLPCRQAGKIQMPNQAQNSNNLNIEDPLKISNFKFQINEYHPWAGITRFKMGFTPDGQISYYPQAFDLIFQPFWYKLYKLVKGN